MLCMLDVDGVGRDIRICVSYGAFQLTCVLWRMYHCWECIQRTCILNWISWSLCSLVLVLCVAANRR